MGARVAVVGAGGRMGRFACELLEESSDFELAARVGSGDDLAAALGGSGAELGLDLTRAGLGAEHGLAMLAAGLRPVIGTSGVTEEELGALDRAARECDLGGIVVPNFSLGMLFVQEAASRAATWFQDAAVIELHHAGKADAPSATSLETARLVRAALPSGGEVPIASVRLPGLVAHQEVLFGAEGELVTLRHDVTSREAYGPGLLLALAHALHAEGVAHGLAAVLRREG